MAKLDLSFKSERDTYYRAALHNLQAVLAALQDGTSEEYILKKQQLEEERDYELTKLRLWEEYQVKRVESEYKDDLQKARDNHDKMIKLIKEKLYDKLQRQIKQLKEDKLLLNLVNANSWNSTGPTDAVLQAAASSSLNLNDRRSLRKRELSSRLTAHDADDLSDGGLGGSTTANGTSLTGGYISTSSGKRRRHYATRYSSNDELSSGVTSNGGNGKVPNHQNGVSSGNESNLSDKDYDALNCLIMGNDESVSLELLEKSGTIHRPHTRGSTKQFVGPQGLKLEELNNDLMLLRNAIVKKEK